MPTDAKCGLLVGVGVVIAVAVLFFQKDPAESAPARPAAAPPAAVRAPADRTKLPSPPPSRTTERGR